MKEAIGTMIGFVVLSLWVVPSILAIFLGGDAYDLLIIYSGLIVLSGIIVLCTKLVLEEIQELKKAR